MARSSKRGRGVGKPRAPRRAPQDLSQPIERLTWTVEADDDGARLDRFLGARLPWRSRTQIVELLAEDRVRVNGQLVRKKSARVRADDEVEVSVPPPAEEVRHEQLADELEPAILHEDDHLLALRKPSGLVVHPVGRVRVNTLIQALHWMFRHGSRRDQRVVGGEREGELGLVIPRICHRLDKDTSGVIVMAKTITARSRLQHIFEGHETRKEYLAILRDAPADDAGVIDRPIGADADSEIDLKMAVRDDGAPSRSDYEVLERFAEHALTRFRIRTGRQHQIRVHAASIGHPVLCDTLYGPGPAEWPGAEPVLSRHALHAERLVLPHPITGDSLELTAPLPADLQAALARLRGDAS